MSREAEVNRACGTLASFRRQIFSVRVPGIGECMTSDDDIDELKAKRLCHQCIGEEYLGAEVRRKGQRGKCSYCDRSARSYTIEDIAERVETAFEQHYTRTSDQPTSWQQSMLSDRESDYYWLRDGEPVVSAIINAPEIPHQ